MQTHIDQLGIDATAQQTCPSVGFPDEGFLGNTNPLLDYTICFEYEDEQGNGCSTVALTAGEHKMYS